MTLEELVTRKIRELEKMYSERIIQGLPSYEEYRFLLGILRGIAEVHRDISPYLKDPDSVNDEEDDA
tara:strand:+ start:525 stop:725 length:201 start_codon:yes stop_codon:yes gene_type:complete